VKTLEFIAFDLSDPLFDSTITLS